MRTHYTNKLTAPFLLGVTLLAAVITTASAGCTELKVGDKCETYRSSECGGPGGACLAVTGGSNYCSHTCNAPADCPSGFKCGDITSTTYDGKGANKGEKTVKMCVR